jgi:cytochrome c oxidase cbb3-type subunit III
MKPQPILHLIAAIAGLGCAACSGSPGRPGPNSQVVPPNRIMDFNILYAQNCAGCHDRDGKGGAAISLSNPVFLAIADDAVIRRTAANGVSGTPMPAFARSAGGMLTDDQINAVVTGIRSWAKPAVTGGDMLPPYTAPAPGDSSHGAQVYTTYCSMCHGPEGRGGSKASSIVNGSYLALVSDQNLRTIVIAGRPELGSPDWRNDVPGNAMSPQDISDVVAWLASQRPLFPGQPYPSASLLHKEGIP